MTEQEFEHRAIGARSQAESVARSMGLNMADAADVASEVMLRLWSMHDRIHPPDSIMPMAHVVSRRLVVDIRRTMHPNIQLDEGMTIAGGQSPQAEMEYREMEEWIDHHIKHLPKTSATILRMRQLEQRDIGEIAQLLGMSKPTVSTLLARARRQLLEQINKDRYE